MAIPIETIEILLIEDNMDDVQMVTMALEESHVVNNVVHLRDGAEALDYIFNEGAYAGNPSNGKAKVIMLDLNMPKVNGLEVLRRLKADDKAKDIPVVVFTSSDEDPNLKECYRLGVNTYIVKPLDYEEFKKAINSSIVGLLKYSSRFR
ncbi:MAG: response regulator [Bacteroidota bacterium]